MPFIMTLAVIYLKMTPLEALQATTHGAAKSLGVADSHGALHAGFRADAVIWNADNYRQLPYFYGVNQARDVVIGGRLITS